MPRLPATQTPDRSGCPSAARGVGFGGAAGAFAGCWACSEAASVATRNAVSILMAAPLRVDVVRIAEPHLNRAAVVEGDLAEEPEVLRPVAGGIAFQHDDL